MSPITQHMRVRILASLPLTRQLLGFVLAALALSLLSTARGEVLYQRLKSFGLADQLGQNPMSELVLGNDGAFYGTTYGGGLSGGGMGVVYRVQPDGSGYQVLHVFTGGTNAAHPLGKLVLAGNSLYGTTSGGGNTNAGVVFRVNTDGTGYTELHRFTGSSDGINPQAGLVFGNDGALYGTTYLGGSAHLGTVFKLSPDGANYTILHQFTGGTDGSQPTAALLQGSDGAFYGTTQYGGNTNRSGFGTIFRLNTDGSSYSVLYAFSNTNGSQPRAALCLGPNNLLLGTTSSGGTHSQGTLFSLQEDGSGFTTVYNFGVAIGDASVPTASLLLGPDGFLYGTTINGGTDKGGTVFKMQPDGSGYTVLAHVPPALGLNLPIMPGLVFGNDGLLYGTDPGGGAENYGFMYRLSPDGSGFSALRSFYSHGGDARAPAATLLRASDGFYYGSAPGGGSNNAGAIFRFAADGSNYGLVHGFVAREGTSPSALVEGLPGVLYGTAASGGLSNMGTIFRLNTDGSGFAVLHDFTGGAADGQRPLRGLLLARDGALYGTTINGGIGFGTIYRIQPDGSGFQVVYTFQTSPNNGLEPLCPLIQGTDDALYGTTDAGGQFGRGSVFKVNTDGSGFTALHHFASDSSDGAGFSQSGLLLGPDNALYGVTAAGSTGAGCVFRVTEDGSQYSVLHLFGPADGYGPQGELLLGADGALYGLTQFGGTFSSQGGTAYKLNPDSSGFAVLHSFPFPVGPEGARSTGGLVAATNGWLLGVTPLGGDFQDGVLFRLEPATPTNDPPSLMSSLPDQQFYVFTPFSYTVPTSSFFDRDWGQTLAISVTALPPFMSFNPATLTLSGTPSAPGSWTITVTATDNGSPAPLSVADSFQFTALLPDLAISQQGSNILLSWPDNTVHWQLQESSQPFSGTNWTSLGLPGGYTIGSRRYTTLPWKPGQWFYRMTGPY